MSSAEKATCRMDRLASASPLVAGMLLATFILAACGVPAVANQVGGLAGAPRLVAQWPVEGPPGSIAVGPDGTVYVTINNNHRVVQYSAAGEYLREWACEGEAAGVAAGPEGLVYLANGALGRVEAWQ